MRKPKRTIENTFWPMLEVFENLEREEMETFCDNFHSERPDIEQELIGQMEWEIEKRIERDLEYRAQKEICFFSEQNKELIREKIKKQIRIKIITKLIK